VTRCLILARQSVADEEGRDSLSLASQEAELRARAAREGWRVVAAVREPGVKGWAELSDRPGLSEAIRRAEAREYDVLLVWDASRLARSVRILETVVHRLERLGVAVVSHTEEWVSSPMLRQVVSAVAEERTREIRRHVRRALNERAHRGLPHGTPPYGYVRAETGGAYAPDHDRPERVSVVRELFARYAAGEGVMALSADLVARGVPSPAGYPYWRTTTLTAILANPAYRGAVVAGGVAVEGAHEALIDAETWERVQQRLAARERVPRRKAATSFLEGAFVHGCGANMYLRPPRANTPSASFVCGVRCHPDQGRVCTVRPQSIAAWKAERAVLDALARDLASVRPAAAVLAEERARLAHAAPTVARAVRELDDREKRAQSRRHRAEELYLSGVRDRAWFDAEDAAAASDLAAIERERGRLPALPDAAAVRRRRAVLVGVRDEMSGADAAELRRRLRAIGRAILDEGGVRAEYHAEFAGFVKGSREDG
jgi:DNA invertase Pin-like site-specific DNA recombinase